jgi:hypothetical protein
VLLHGAQRCLTWEVGLSTTTRRAGGRNCRRTNRYSLGEREAGPLNISIGRFPMALFLPPDARLRDQARQRYREFGATSPNHLPVFVRPLGRGGSSSGGYSSNACLFAYQLDDAKVVLRRSAADFVGVRHEYALDSLIRILLTAVLLPQKGFLLHAATVVRDGRAYVFAGRSGAGKSTVARLSPGGSVLTDEISVLRYSEGEWFAHGTPFWGEFRAAGRNEQYPLAGIFALNQAPEDRVEPLAPKETLRALLPCILFFTAEPEANRALLGTLTELVHQVPCHRLHFRRDAAFWGVIAP